MPVKHMVLIDNGKLNKYELFTVYTEQARSPYTEHAASGLPNPIHLEVDGRGGYDLSRLKTSRLPHVVRE